MNQTQPLQGWTSSPNGRGTFDILSSSAITVFLCSWSVLSLNVYPPRFTDLHKLWRKCQMTFLGAMGPEFIFQLAAGQWCSAHRSVLDFRNSNKKSPGREPWTMAHAFYANMGGFALRTQLSWPTEEEFKEFPLFPLNAKQVLYLVENKYISYEEVCIDKELIRDRDKVDGMVRLITVCQISWYFIGCMARIYQHLSVTILELATLGFILSSIGTYAFWWFKPNDVSRAIVLRPTKHLDQILVEAGDRATDLYLDTPLDFVGREIWSWTYYWTHWKGMLRILFRVDFDQRKRPMESIPDDNFPIIVGWPLWALFVAQIGYGAVHLSGWNFPFPTATEQLVWHITTVIIMTSILVTWAVEIILWRTTVPGSLSGHKKEAPANVDIEMNRFQRAITKVKNTTYPRNPAMDVPLRAHIPVTLSGAMYCFARAYVIIEGLIGLRALPPSAYESVNWTAFWPNFR